ncbi:MAG: hypothetical protein EA397_08275 [Deltaproteobacteria bacterium]|nr:MAG: hypothetical protein EA397_08275 [Deltaproteobacteria bacterium]
MHQSYRIAIALFGLSVGLPAKAGTIAVVAEAQDGPLPAPVFSSVIWHALYDKDGHDAVFLPRLDASAVQAMQGTAMTTLLHAELVWRPESLRIGAEDHEAHLIGGYYPHIKTTEYALRGDRLVATRTWSTTGPLSVYKVTSPSDDHFIGLPEVSLQETVVHALQAVQAPVWTEEPDVITVPVILAADEEYRSFYGSSRWQGTAGRAVDRANALLRAAGLRLEVIEHQRWTSPDELTDLSDLLRDLHAQPRSHGNALRVGFTGQTRLEATWESHMEDVGRAYTPGRDLLVADQASPPGHDPAWDVAEEGVAVAHEVLHALGLPHVAEDDALMSATKRGTVHRISKPSADLAKTAASARFNHWDTLAALASLSAAAEQHLDDLDLQLDYISENLAFGPGVPRPGALQPRQLSALTNVAIGRYYLRQTSKDPDEAQELRQRAHQHTESAMAQEPSWKALQTVQRQMLAVQPSSLVSSSGSSPEPPPRPSDIGEPGVCLDEDPHPICE